MNNVRKKSTISFSMTKVSERVAHGDRHHRRRRPSSIRQMRERDAGENPAPLFSGGHQWPRRSMRPTVPMGIEMLPEQDGEGSLHDHKVPASPVPSSHRTSSDKKLQLLFPEHRTRSGPSDPSRSRAIATRCFFQKPAHLPDLRGQSQRDLHTPPYMTPVTPSLCLSGKSRSTTPCVARRQHGQAAEPFFCRRLWVWDACCRKAAPPNPARSAERSYAEEQIASTPDQDDSSSDRASTL